LHQLQEDFTTGTFQHELDALLVFVLLVGAADEAILLHVGEVDQVYVLVVCEVEGETVDLFLSIVAVQVFDQDQFGRVLLDPEDDPVGGGRFVQQVESELIRECPFRFHHEFFIKLDDEREPV